MWVDGWVKWAKGEMGGGGDKMGGRVRKKRRMEDGNRD